MQKFRTLLARLVSAGIPQKVMRHQIRGVLEFGLGKVARVLWQNWERRNQPPVHEVAICAIAKNEGSYFQEWIEWHSKLGITRFYIYDNESTDETQQVLKPYVDSGLVVYRFIPGKKMQTKAYNDCLAQHRYEARWIAFIDLDEFLVPVATTTIPDFLKDFQQAAAIEINWLCFGSGGAINREPGLVMDRFLTHALPECPLNRHVKSIVNPRRALNFISSHHPTRLWGKAVDTNGRSVKSYFFDRNPLHDKIRINHYAVKSYDEFLQKKSRGRGMSLSQRGMDYFLKFDRNEVGGDFKPQTVARVAGNKQIRR